MTARKTAALAACLFLAASAARAADGRIPIYELPVTISSPGSYYLTRDLTHGSAGESIILSSSDVTLDFAGHTLTQTTLGNYAISMDGDYTRIQIRNGNLVGGNIGIRLRNTVGDDFVARIEDMTIAGALNEGIYVQGHSLIGSSQVYINRNQIHDNGNDGIRVTFAWGGQIRDNVIQGSGTGAGEHGIYLNSCRGVSLRNNTISHSGADGIRIWYSWYCHLEGNHTSYGNDWGINIYQGDSHVFRNNTNYGNGSGGMTVPINEGHVNAGGNYPPPS